MEITGYKDNGLNMVEIHLSDRDLKLLLMALDDNYGTIIARTQKMADLGYSQASKLSALRAERTMALIQSIQDFYYNG